jgi:NADH-quinone oxidoreductase subunit A
MPADFFPLLLYFVFALIVGGALIVLNALLGPKKDTAEKLDTYECGVPPVGGAHERFPIKFYVIGMLFILFDIEVVFLYPWAVVAKNLGVFGYVAMGVFILSLLEGFVYVWKKGALEWE